jgi:hypothetical protein
MKDLCCILRLDDVELTMARSSCSMTAAVLALIWWITAANGGLSPRMEQQLQRTDVETISKCLVTQSICT